MFIGEYSHTVDAKGRTTMPMKYRKELGESFYIIKGADECLFVLNEEGWQKFVQRVEEEADRPTDPAERAKKRRSKRKLFASAVEGALDKQGRILINNTLRDYAHIQKDIVFIGVKDHIEIWDKDYWDEYNDLSDDCDDLDGLM